MEVYVNDKPIEVLPGMKVKHALRKAELLQELEGQKKVYDEWANELGVDGALSEAMKIYVR